MCDQLSTFSYSQIALSVMSLVVTDLWLNKIKEYFWKILECIGTELKFQKKAMIWRWWEVKPYTIVWQPYAVLTCDRLVVCFIIFVFWTLLVPNWLWCQVMEIHLLPIKLIFLVILSPNLLPSLSVDMYNLLIFVWWNFQLEG
jgi:hypothetical protein